MKVLDVTLFREGMQRNVETLMRLEEEMQMIRAATEELISLQESLKGEGGDAIRAFYRDCHLPLLQYFVLFKSQFESILQQMDSALNALEPAADGHIRESFLESEIEAGLSEIATLTGSLTDEANAIMDEVADIVGLPKLDDTLVHESIAPFTHPNKAALAKVIIKAGSGAATDCNIISKNDITGAHIPNDNIYFLSPSKSNLVKYDTMLFITSFTGFTNMYTPIKSTIINAVIQNDLFKVLLLFIIIHFSPFSFIFNILISLYIIKYFLIIYNL